jgi:3-oxoacyl-[acyl-carrier protein] reductase
LDTSLRLNEKTALVTAGCSSLGRVLALRLSELGVHVAMVDGPGKGGDRLAEEIMNLREVHERRGKGAFFQATYAEPQAMIDCVGRAAESFGGLDILVDAQLLDAEANFSRGKNENFDERLNEDFKNSLVLTKKACDIFRVRKKGRIIFLVPETQLAGLDGWGPTREGFLKYTSALAREFLQEQVTVNGVAVGPTEEYLMKRRPGAKSIQAAHQELFKDKPLIKIAEPQDTANLIAFLASPLASGVTGQCISAAGTLSLLA